MGIDFCIISLYSIQAKNKIQKGPDSSMWVEWSQYLWLFGVDD